MITDLMKAPMVYAGGKRAAAAHIWAALGDVGHFVDPCMGSMAVLLCRPHLANRPYYSETVNDVDGLLVNAYRAITYFPDETAEWCSWPVSEIDQAARQLACVKWLDEQQYEYLMTNTRYCNPEIAGYWLYGMGTWIGFGFADGKGAWVERDGRLVKLPKPGRGVGISQKRPNTGNDGRGVHCPQLREAGLGAHSDPDWQFHPLTMPELRRWFGALSARLRHVRITCGDWKRVLTPSASITLSCDKQSPCGVLLDPPYADTANRAKDLYRHDSGDMAHAMRHWALKHGDNPLYRIVFCGFEGEHGSNFHDAGWTEVSWFTSGFLTGGYGNQGEDGHQQHRERLWLSPHCIQPAAAPTLFDGMWDDEEEVQDADD